MGETRREIDRPWAFNQPVTCESTLTVNGQLTVNAGLAFEVGDDDRFTLGADNDQVLVNRSTTNAANTAITGVLDGTPVTPAIAANSLIISNTTASGDILVAADVGGNSQAWVWIDASAGLAQLLGAGTAVFEWQATLLEVKDDILFTLGTDGDGALVHRTATLAANTALTGVLVGTPASAATPANSQLISNVTADGDIAIFTRNAAGANSIEGLRFDASAGLIVFNEAAADWDVRIEGDNNANMIVSDGGTDSLALGAAVVSGAFLAIDGSAVNRSGVTSVGRGEHMPTATFTQTNADPTTLAVSARVLIGVPTFAGANANQTLTDASTVYLAGAAAAGTNVTITNRPQTLTVAAGKSSFTPTATVASAAGADLTGIAVPATTVTLTGTTQVTAAQGLINIAQPTLTDGSAVTVDTYASLYIANAPAQAGSVTLTAGYALWVDAGTTRLDGTTLILGGISYTVPPDDGDSGEQLQTNGSGVLTWESAASSRAVKDLLGYLDPREALARICAAPVHRFRYKAEARHVGGDYETEFAGIVADEAPWAMKHRGRIFNPISAFGHAAAAIQAIEARLAMLEGAHA